MEATALHVGGEAGVNMWNFLFKHSFRGAFIEIIFSKDSSIKSSLLKLNTVFGVVMIILVKNNYRELLYMKMRQLCQ